MSFARDKEDQELKDDDIRTDVEMDEYNKWKEKKMKQHITLEQLNELSQKGKRKYRDYSKINKWRKPNNDYDLWSIGQMIQFLDENIKSKRVIGWGLFGHYTTSKMYEFNSDETLMYSEGELCDSLWGAVKEILERKKGGGIELICPSCNFLFKKVKSLKNIKLVCPNCKAKTELPGGPEYRDF